MTNWLETYQDINEDTLRLAENAPMIQPVVSATREASRDNNNLLGKTFQFAYQWAYKDYRFSILSPYSELFVSRELTKNVQTYDNELENKITVTVFLGNSEVRSVRILAREGNNGSWFVCGVHDRSSSIEFNSFNFDFYDDSVREYVDMTSALSTYHNVPLIARNIETVDNKIVLSDCITGYDSDAVNYTLGIAYGDPVIESANVTIPVVVNIDSPNSYHTNADISIKIPSVVKGQTVVLDVRWSGSFRYPTTLLNAEVHAYKFRLSRTIYINETMSAEAFTTIFQDAIRDAATLTRSVDGGSETQWEITNALAIAGADRYILLRSYVTGSKFITYGFPTSSSNSYVTYARGMENTFAKFSSYNVGVAYYDKVGRTNGVLTCVNKAIYIPGDKDRDPANVGAASYISWNLSTPPPYWAFYYRMCVSESISFAGLFSVHTNSNCYEVTFDGRTVLALDIWGSDYQYVIGDLLIKELEDGSVKTKPILQQTALVHDIDSDEDKSGNFILVPKDSDLVSGTDLDVNYSQCALSIHRQKKNSEESVYFEDFNTYEIVNPRTEDRSHGSASGVLKCGDTWIRTKDYVYKDDAPYIFVGEEFYINSDMGVKAYSKGRPMVSLKDFGQKDQPVMLWGGSSFYDTKTNEISAFNFTDTMMMDAKDGHITQVVMVGDVLKVLQERKETSIYVGKSVFTDAGGNAQLSQISGLFGNKNPSSSDYGVNYKTASVVNGRLLFYWDQDKGEVIQSSPNGQLPISRIGFESYFKSKKDLIDDRVDSGADFKVVFGYDAATKELLVLFHIGSSAEVCVFDAEENQWVLIVDMTKTVSNVMYSSDRFMTLGSHLISTVCGFMYAHDGEEDKSYIYDEHKPIDIRGVLNDFPSTEKMLLDMSIDADGELFVETETPQSATISSQWTYNTPQSLRRKNGRYTAPFLRNVKLPSGISSDVNLLYSGVKMRGRIAYLNIKSNMADGFEFRDIAVNWLQV